MLLVEIAFCDRTLGDTVRGEDHRQSRSVFGAGFFPTGAQFLREGFYEQWMIIPLLDEVQLKRKIPVAANRAAVESNAGARILRSETDGDDALESLARNCLHRVADERLPVAHADENRHLQ